MNRYFFIYAVVTILIITSCKTIQKGESVIEHDAEPPLGYNPSFIIDKKQFNPDFTKEPEVQISMINTNDPGNVRVKFHLIDEKAFYLTGAADKKFSDIWCKFYLEHNGKVQPIKEFKLVEITDEQLTPNNLAIVMDHSGSMGEWRANEVQKAVKKLIDEKREIDKLALIKYDNNIGLASQLTASKQELLMKHKVEGLTGYGGMTAIANSTVKGIDELKSSPESEKRAVVIFTDGFDNSSTISPDSAVNYALDNNAIICGVDFGANIDGVYMKNMAETSGGIYHHIYRTVEFNLVFEDIYNRLNNYYMLEFDPGEYGEYKLLIDICLPKDTLHAERIFNNTPDPGRITRLKINFDFDKATLTKESKQAIDNIYHLMKGFPQMKIELRGHTDSKNSSDDPDYNLKLSQKRADAVKNALAKMGITENRIISIGFGDKVPIADNSTTEGRSENRRTELIILNY